MCAILQVVPIGYQLRTVFQFLEKKKMQKKIKNAKKLLRAISASYGGELEVAYSGGKDSDVILQLCKEADVPHRAVYKNTTIDPPRTIAHAREVGAEILRPKKTFFDLVRERGFPNRFRRFCCAELKEYKVGDKVVVGVRRAESSRRAERYKEPTMCRYYSKSSSAELIFPILDWTNADVSAFIKSRKLKCADWYYDADGYFHVERRLGCLCCPLATQTKRISEFEKFPKMVRAYIKAGQFYLDNHQDKLPYNNAYEWFVREVFFRKQADFDFFITNNLFEKKYFLNPKEFLENKFKIEL